MPHNEGFLGKQEIGGNSVYTEDHKPVILNGKLKVNHADISEGSVLTFDTDGKLDVIGASNTLQIAGVAVEAVSASDAQGYIAYLAHGTVKAAMLQMADGAAFTDYAKLAATGIYAI